MPVIIFDGQCIDISAGGYAKVTALALYSFTHTPAERREALLDVLFDEGVLCDVCGSAVGTQQAQYHEDVRLCVGCATVEPYPEEEPRHEQS